MMARSSDCDSDVDELAALEEVRFRGLGFRVDPLYGPIRPLYNPYIISRMVLGDVIFRSLGGPG